MLVANESLRVESEHWREKYIADYLRTSLPLIILPVSLINNVLSFVTLRSRTMRGTSTTFFMLLLSVFDPLVLITKNFLYFPQIFVANRISCKLLYFFVYVIGYTNVWILVIMTGDKFFAVWFPLKVNYFCTINRAKMICFVLLFISSLVSVHHFWTIDSLVNPNQITQRYCGYDSTNYSSVEVLWRYIDFLIWCFFPLLVIFSLSLLIIIKLNQRRVDQRFSLIQHRPSFTPSSTNLRNIRNNVDGLIVRTSQSRKVVRSKHRHVTLMLLTVAFVFLILTLPNSIYFVLEQTYSFAVAPTTNDYADWLRYRRLKIVSVIMFQLTDLQHATNFYLYLLTSRKFRQALSKNFKEFFKKFCQTRSDRSWSKQSVIFSRTSGTGSVRKSRSASVIQNPNRSLNIECRCSEEIL